MNTHNAWQTRATPITGAYLDEGLRRHMLRVYNYMGLGLALTGIVAAFCFGERGKARRAVVGKARRAKETRDRRNVAIYG